MDTKKLRQKILDLAIRGKLVPQDPNDEPASMLLERIRAEKERLIAEGKIKRPKKSKSSSSESHYQQFEPPFSIPDSWEWVRLGEIAYVASGSTPSKESFTDSGIPYLKMYNLRDQKIDFDYHPQYISEEIHNGKLARSRAQSGDLIMNIVGPPLGKLAIIPESIQHCNFNQAAVMIRPYLEVAILNKYLFFYLSEMSEINSIVTKGTAGQTNISLSQSQNMRIPVPPLGEMERINYKTSILISLIEDIENYTCGLHNSIKSVKNKILELAMQGKLVPQDPADEPAADMLLRINPRAKIITDNPHSWNIPSSWTWCYLGDIFQHNTGKALNSSNKDGIDYEYITTSNVYWGRFVLGDLNKMPFKENEIEKCTVSKGDLLVCEGGDVGRAAIWNLEKNILIQNHLHRLRPLTNEICTALYFHVFRLYKDRDLIGGKGIALQGFSSKSLHHLIVPLPPSNEQKRIAIQIEELYSTFYEIEASLQS